MPMPFPGMNPYLEDSTIWLDYLTTLLLHLRARINEALPARYVARIDRYVWIHEPSEESSEAFIRGPDVFVAEEEVYASAATAVIALEAPVMSVMPAVRRKGHAYLVIVDAQGRRVVTVVEILSPSNKSPGEDRDAYLAKRGEYLASGANFVEINLLRGGRQSPMGKPAPPKSDYSIVISQAAEFPRAGVWPIGIRDRLPIFPIPLSPGEQPIYVDLQACHERSCLEGQYEKDIDYTGPPPAPPLLPEDAAWLAQMIGANSKRRED